MPGEGKRNRQRGDRFERSVVDLLQSYGLSAERVPLSGSVGGSFAGDISCPVMGRDAKFECKVRRALPAYLIEPLGQNYGTFFKQDRGETYVLLKASTFASLLRSAESFRCGRYSVVGGVEPARRLIRALGDAAE